MADEQKSNKEVAVTVRSLLSTESVKARFEEVLGHRAPQFTSSILTLMGTNTQLNEVDPHSVIRAAAIAASIDLPITPGLGQAHIVPYKGVATFQIGWKGLTQLAHRTEKYKTLHASKVLDGQIVKNDPFTGDMEFQAKASSDKTAGYLFYFKLLNGFEKYVYMTVAECQAHAKRYSQTYKQGKGKWVDDFDSMALKTVVKMGLSKWGVLSVDLQRAIEFDQAAVKEDNTPEYIDSTATPADESPIKTPEATDTINAEQVQGIKNLAAKNKVPDDTLNTYVKSILSADSLAEIKTADLEKVLGFINDFKKEPAGKK